MLGTIFAGAMLSMFSPNTDLLPPKAVTDGNIEQVSTRGYLSYLKRKKRRLQASIAAGNSQDIAELQRVERQIKQYRVKRGANTLQEQVNHAEENAARSDEALNQDREKRKQTLDAIQKILEISQQACQTGCIPH